VEPLAPSAQYVRSRAVLERLQRLGGIDAPGEVPLDLLYSGAGDLTLRQRPQVIKVMKEQVSGAGHGQAGCYCMRLCCLLTAGPTTRAGASRLEGVDIILV
jgi:hypothetical protein